MDGPDDATDAQIMAEFERQRPDLSSKPVAPAAPAAPAAPTEPAKNQYDLGEVPVEAALNAPKDAWNVAKGLAKLAAGVLQSNPAPLSVTPLGNQPYENYKNTPLGKELTSTVPNLLGMATGAMVNTAALPVSYYKGVPNAEVVNAFTTEAPLLKGSVDIANAVGGHLADSYGGYEEIKRSLAEKPVSSILDLTALLQGGAGLAKTVGATRPAQVANKLAQGVTEGTATAVNKLTDLGAWTFDTLTGKRSELAAGRKARELVGAENIDAARAALQTPRTYTPPVDVQPSVSGRVPEATRAPDEVPAEALTAGQTRLPGENPEVLKGTAANYAKADDDLLNAIEGEFTEIVNPRTPRDIGAAKPTAPQAIYDAEINAPAVAALKPGDAAFGMEKKTAQVNDRAALLAENTPDLKQAIADRREATKDLFRAGDESIVEITPAISEIVSKHIKPSQYRILAEEAAAQKRPIFQVQPSVAEPMTVFDYATGAIKKVPVKDKVYPKVAGEELFNFRSMLQDIAYGNPKTNAAEISQRTAQTILNDFEKELFKVIPDYGKAVELHQKMSVPVNQSIIMNYYAKKLKNSLVDTAENAKQFTNLSTAMDELPGGIKNALAAGGAPTKNRSVNSLLDDNAKAAIGEVERQLKRDKEMAAATSAGGKAEMKKIIDDESPKLVEYAPLNMALNFAVKIVNKLGVNVSRNSKDLLIESAKDPEKFLKVLDTLPTSEKSAVLKAFKDAKLPMGEIAAPTAINNLLPQEEKRNASQR